MMLLHQDNCIIGYNVLSYSTLFISYYALLQYFFHSKLVVGGMDSHAKYRVTMVPRKE